MKKLKLLTIVMAICILFNSCITTSGVGETLSDTSQMQSMGHDSEVGGINQSIVMSGTTPKKDFFSDVTHIVKARCSDYTVTGDYRRYEFSVEKQYFGTSTESTICVIGLDYPPFYEKGKEYYLPLKKAYTAFVENHYFYGVCRRDLVISVDDVENAILGDDPLIRSLPTEQAELVGEIGWEAFFETYENPEALDHIGGQMPILATDMETIVTLSPYVFRIRTGKIIPTEEGFSCHSDCTVVSSLKGDVETGKILEISFPADKVLPDTEYIVATTGTDDGPPTSYCFITSYNSVFDISQEEEIKELLQAG